MEERIVVLETKLMAAEDLLDEPEGTFRWQDDSVDGTAVRVLTTSLGGGRGVLQVGKKGDVNVIDLDALTLEPAHVAYDLPAGGRRVMQRASGYVATVVSGTVIRRDGVDTGARPGRVLRGAR